jgi:hypothetical protein
MSEASSETPLGERCSAPGGQGGLSSFQQLDSLFETMWALYSCADVALHRGQHERALHPVGACDSLRDPVGRCRCP